MPLERLQDYTDSITDFQGRIPYANGSWDVSTRMPIPDPHYSNAVNFQGQYFKCTSCCWSVAVAVAGLGSLEGPLLVWAAGGGSLEGPLIRLVVAPPGYQAQPPPSISSSSQGQWLNQYVWGLLTMYGGTYYQRIWLWCEDGQWFYSITILQCLYRPYKNVKSESSLLYIPLTLTLHGVCRTAMHKYYYHLINIDSAVSQVIMI